MFPLMMKKEVLVGIYDILASWDVLSTLSIRLFIIGDLHPVTWQLQFLKLGVHYVYNNEVNSGVLAA